MKLSTHHNSTGRVITIETDEELDLRSHGVFVEACRLAEHLKQSRIDVNLGKTRTLRDSGMAMLLLLHRRSGGESRRIRLLNCHPDIRKRLMTNKVAQQFQVV